MDIAERYGLLLRRLLCSAERFNERAMRRRSSWANTPLSRSSALLVSITCRDQRLGSDLGLPFLVGIAHRSCFVIARSARCDEAIPCYIERDCFPKVAMTDNFKYSFEEAPQYHLGDHHDAGIDSYGTVWMR